MDIVDVIIDKNKDIQKIEKNVQVLTNRLLELEKENYNLKPYKKAFDDLIYYIGVLQESYFGKKEKEGGK
jgi:hypothetical protein